LPPAESEEDHIWVERESSMSTLPNVVRSRQLAEGQSGELLGFSREDVHWQWMSMKVRRLAPGESYATKTQGEEAAFVILGGRCTADWGAGPQSIGARKNVFAGLPYCVYLPTDNAVKFTGETAVEIAECRVPSNAKLEAKLITPEDVLSSLRGGGNASRQIVDIIRPDFPADKLVAIEVYTPAGNWSSFPPHKHEVHNPPVEVDLDEIYYYRIDRPREGFALQRLYASDNSSDETVRAADGDAVLVRSGYHPVVAGPGYNVYYLNFLAGSSRTLAVTEDPNHVWLKATWKDMDPRLPLVR
jgi:5-deoxy-glucuronate isomerase